MPASYFCFYGSQQESVSLHFLASALPHDLLPHSKQWYSIFSLGLFITWPSLLTVISLSKGHFWLHLESTWSQAYIPHHKIPNLIISEAVMNIQLQDWCKHMPLFLLSKWLEISGTATSRWWVYNIWEAIKLFSKVIIIISHSYKHHKMSTHPQQQLILSSVFILSILGNW